MKIVEMIYGSHLYGTSDKNSDKDIKIVYLPSLQDCVLGKIKNIINERTNKTNLKNTSFDVDKDIYSLQYFLLELGKNGDATFLDMIHASELSILEISKEWQFIRNNRQKFYTRNFKAYKGYLKNQITRFKKNTNELDCKGLYQALRIAIQLQEIYCNGDLIFPLKEADYLKQVKLGNCDASDISHLQSLFEKIENLSLRSDFPEEVNIKYWEEWIYSKYN